MIEPVGEILDVEIVGADVGDARAVGRELGEHQRSTRARAPPSLWSLPLADVEHPVVAARVPAPDLLRVGEDEEFACRPWTRRSRRSRAACASGAGRSVAPADQDAGALRWRCRSGRGRFRRGPPRSPRRSCRPCRRPIQRAGPNFFALNSFFGEDAARAARRARRGARGSAARAKSATSRQPTRGDRSLQLETCDLRLETRYCAQLSDAPEVIRERRHAALGLRPVEVLVGRVVAVFRQRQSQEEDRALQDLFHREDRADRAALAHEDGLLAERELHRAADRVGVRSRRLALVGRQLVLGGRP